MHGDSMENVSKYVIVALVALVGIGAVVYAHPWTSQTADMNGTQQDVLESMAQMHNYMHNTSYTAEEFENLMGNGVDSAKGMHSSGMRMGGMHGSGGQSRGSGMGCH